ncbi:ROK family transcriptional regulator [Shimia biformata]|uniref:ROK family transcriptional regulator n=1 Tax=Shimia biformata TaxID=1294299 RepID=UPI001EF3D0BE|nr:ROK family transcriptional regulator [Shimia biformata]
MAGLQRSVGRRVLLQQIRHDEAVPRIDLAEKTGISRATVTTITAELLKAGLIEEVAREGETSGSKRGRPKVDLKIRGAARIVAGVKISHRSFSLVLIDFEGNLLAEHECEMSAPTLSAEDMAQELRDGVDALAALAGKSRKDISGVGVGIAGVVDAPEGFVHWSPSLNRRNVALAATIEAAMGVPVFVDNDANLVAVAEKSFGLGRAVSDFIVVTIEAGVGMGIVIGGELYRGTRGCGAEFGHTKVHLEGALCRCGQRGCLEAYVADYALLREASVAGFDPQAGRQAERVVALLSAAREGDALARSIVERAGRMFAMGLANIVNIFDPQLIILAGEQMQFDHLYAEEVIDEMKKSIVQIDKAPPEVVIHKWGNLMWAKGGAAYALDRVSDLALEELGDNAD